MLVAKWGARRTLACFLALSGFGCVLFATSSSLSAIMLGRVLCGMGVAVLLTSAMALFVRWFPAEAYGRLCGWFFCFGGMGAILGTAPLAVLNDVLGWRTLFLGLGIATFAVALACLAFVRNQPDKALSAVKVELAPLRFTEILFRLKSVARQTDFWRLSAWFFCISGIYYGFFALWGGPYLAQAHRLPQHHIGGVLSMGAMGFVFGSPVYTWIWEKIFKSYRGGLCVSGVLAFVCCGIFSLSGKGFPLPLLYVVALCLGIACNAPNALAYASARNLFGPAMTATLSGILGFCAFMGGASLQSLGGLLIDTALRHGWSVPDAYKLLFAPYFIYAIVSFVLLWKLTETCPLRDEAQGRDAS